MFYLTHFYLGTSLHVYVMERRFNPLFHVQELFKIDLPTDKPSELELITFIETLITIRNLLIDTLLQIEIIEKLITNDKFSENNDLNSDDLSYIVESRLIQTIRTPQNKSK